jgi:regulatory protein
MERAGVEAAASEQALAMLAELGYVDDARFARRFAADRRELDGWGGKRIRARLEAAGVERELIEVALAEHAPQGDELESALAVLRQRIPQPPADERACQRALGVLVRRGYESEVAYEAVRLYARQHRDAA